MNYYLIKSDKEISHVAKNYMFNKQSINLHKSEFDLILNQNRDKDLADDDGVTIRYNKYHTINTNINNIYKKYRHCNIHQS